MSCDVQERLDCVDLFSKLPSYSTVWDVRMLSGRFSSLVPFPLSPVSRRYEAGEISVHTAHPSSSICHCAAPHHTTMFFSTFAPLPLCARPCIQYIFLRFYSAFSHSHSMDRCCPSARSEGHDSTLRVLKELLRSLTRLR